MEFLVLGLFVVILFSFWLWNTYNKMKRDLKSCDPLPPGSFGIPIFGETFSFLMQGSSFYDSKLKQYGKIYKTHLFGNPTIRVVGEESVLYVLSGENDIVTSHWPKSTRLLLNGGLLLESSGPTHSLWKKAVLKAFSHKALDRYIPVLVETCRSYIDTWCQRQRVILYPDLKRLTFHVTSKTLTGVHLTADEVSISMNLFQDFVNGIFSLPVNLPFCSFRKAVTAKKELIEKIERHLNSSPNGSSTNVMTFFLSHSNNEALNRDTVRNICLDLLFAGHETTSSAACFLILYLSQHKEVLSKLQKELLEKGIFSQAENDTLSFESINCLEYLRNVVKETVRLCCPIGAGFRKVLKTFSLGGYQIPKGWLLAYSIRESHLTSEFFSAPREFIPERWTGADEISRHFLCFGRGKRRCVGKDYSMLFMKILIIEMMRTCDWKVENLCKGIIHFPSPHPSDGMPVGFKRK